MSYLATLPLDVRVHIISFISSKKDLLALYPTCKSLYHATTPRLYRHMTIHEDIDTELIIAALSRDNTGLEHVRHVEIMPHELRLASSCEDYQAASSWMNNALSMLAHALLRDVLLTFT